MFALSDIHVSFGGKPTLRGVSWRIEPGERVAIVGPNGAGKTTMLRLMAGELAPDAGEIILPNRADVGYLPQDVEPIRSERTLRAEVETVFAPVHRAEAEMRRLEHEMAEIEDHESAAFLEIAARYDGCQRLIDRMEGHSIDARVGRVLAGLGFEEWQFDKPMRALSGGWQMRAHLAKLLLAAPDLMLLDEPTNHLDLETMLWLEDWIRASNAAVLMVSHERAFMDRLCHRIFELHAGTIEIFKGNYSKYLAERDQRREVQKRAFENQQREINQTQRFIDRFRAKATKASQVQSRVKALEKMERREPPPSDPRTIHFQFPPVARSGKEVLSLEGVSHTYTDAPVISDVNLTLYRGDRIALVGVNGAGKSTLLKILSGRMEPTEGRREVGLNTAIDTFTQGQWDTLSPQQTVLRTLQAAAPGESEQNLRSCLGAFCFSGEDVDKRIEVLSGGEKTRVRLAMMLFSKANVLLMDEPTNHLDIWSRMTLEDALKRYEGTLIVVSHDRYFLDRVTEKVIEIRDGDVHFYPGKYSDYLRRVESHGEDNGSSPEPVERTPTKHREANARAVRADAKRSEEEQALLAQINATPQRYRGKKSKDQKRREADQRNRQGKVLKPLQRRAKKLEDEIQLREIRVNAINTELSQPGAYDDQARVAELMKERKGLTTEIEKMTKEWETALTEIEEIRGN